MPVPIICKFHKVLINEGNEVNIEVSSNQVQVTPT